MKILIFYFSGSGNTELVTKSIKYYFLKAHHTVDLINMDHPFSHELKFHDIDLFGFGYPVHALNAPKIVFQYLNQLPRLLKRKKTFLFKTSGDPLGTGGSSLFVKNILYKKHFLVCYERLFVLPVNILFRYPSNLETQLFKHAFFHAKLFVEEISQNLYSIQKNPTWLNVLSDIFSQLETYGVSWIGSTFRANNDCNLCKKCINSCPTGNITYSNGRIKFHDRCVLCTRCYHNCPTSAIWSPYLPKSFFKLQYQPHKISLGSKFKNPYLKGKSSGYLRHYVEFLVAKGRLTSQYSLKIFQKNRE